MVSGRISSGGADRRAHIQIGAPQAQPGDFFDATVDMTSSQPIAVKIAIDRKVEK
jgi:hypothetical protein